MIHVFLFTFLLFLETAAALANPESEATSRYREKSDLLDVIRVTDERGEKERAYESLNQETVIPRSDITKGNTKDVSELLQRVPGVSVSGGGEAHNKKVSIRGLEGFRVVQQVDGALRQESTQDGLSSGVFVEPELLSRITVQNGADSVGSINASMGGNIQYKTINPEDLLSGNKKNVTKVKAASDSASDGMAQSIQAAARIDTDSSMLFGATFRHSSKIESGSSGEGEEDQKIVEDIDSKRSTYLGKYTYKGERSKTNLKAEYSEAVSKNAAYLAGADEENSDYRNGTFEVALGHQRDFSGRQKFEVSSYYNRTESIKDTHSAYRGIQATVGRVSDVLENAGMKLTALSLMPLSDDWVLHSKNGLEGFGSKIAEDDGTDSPYFGESQGFDGGIVSENSLSLAEDKVVFSLGGRYTNYSRQSNKLSLKSPSKNDTALSGVLGLSYAPTEWLKFSGKLGASSRAPNVREMYYGTGKPWRCHRPAKECTAVPNSNLGKERADSKEVAILLHLPEGEPPSQLKVTYFEDTIGDYIEYMPQMYRVESGTRVIAGPSTATHREYQYRNLSTVVRHGIEAQARAERGDWEFETSYSKIRMECRDCPDMFTATTVTEPLSSAPADKLGLAVGYELQAWKLQMGASAQFVSAQEDLSERYLLAGYGTPAYDVYGLNMRWSPLVKEMAQFEVGLGIGNLFDRKYVVHNSPSGTFESGRSYSASIAAIF